MAFGAHWYDLFPCMIAAIIWLVPIVIGFSWIVPDANRRTMPGFFWAVLTIPFGWLGVLAYLFARGVNEGMRGPAREE